MKLNIDPIAKSPIAYRLITMVTRKVIRISPEEAAAIAAEKALASSAVSKEAVSVADELETLGRNPPSRLEYVKPSPSPPQCLKQGAKDKTCSFAGCNKNSILLGLCIDHGGLVQLCRSKGCINKVNFDIKGGLCRLHRIKGSEQNDEGYSTSEEEDTNDSIRLCSHRGCISFATTDEGLCDRHSNLDNNDRCHQVEKKLNYFDIQTKDSVGIVPIKDAKKRQREKLVVDLTGVPYQTPILKSKGRVKEGASKYTGVSFQKNSKKWWAVIMIDKKQYSIGYYDKEEDAAIDYARAVYKYKSVKRKRKRRKYSKNKLFANLKDIPEQPLILKNDPALENYSDNTRRRNVKEGSSKYTGVYYAKDMNKWKAQIMIEGKVRSIGYYDIEEEAAADYARAAFKYKPKKEEGFYGGLDLKDIPDQPSIRNEEAKSGWKGVKKNKEKWEARIKGKTLGSFDTKEEAAGIYARARYYFDRKVGESSKQQKQLEREEGSIDESPSLVYAV